MAEEQSAKWPHFRRVTYSAPTGIPHGWDVELLDKGAPDGLVCTAARELILFEHPNAGPLVCLERVDRIITSAWTHELLRSSSFRTGHSESVTRSPDS